MSYSRLKFFAWGAVVAFAVFWDGQTRLVFDEGGLGALISLLVLVGALAVPAAFDR